MISNCKKDTNWVDLELTPNWINRGGDYYKAQYRLRNNIVYLRGIVEHTVEMGNDTVIGILPSGFRPLKHSIQNIQITYTTNSGTMINSIMYSVTITIDGAIILWKADNDIKKINWVSLDNISYFID